MTEAQFTFYMQLLDELDLVQRKIMPLRPEDKDLPDEVAMRTVLYSIEVFSKYFRQQRKKAKMNEHSHAIHRQA